MKRKRIAIISMAQIEDTGELEGKKSLFEDTLVFFFSKLRRSGKNPATFVYIFKAFFQFSGKVNYRFDCGFIV